MDNIICRCEEVTEQEIRDAIRQFDLRTVNDVKRLTGAPVWVYAREGPVSL